MRGAFERASKNRREAEAWRLYSAIIDVIFLTSLLPPCRQPPPDCCRREIDCRCRLIAALMLAAALRRYADTAAAACHSTRLPL